MPNKTRRLSEVEYTDCVCREVWVWFLRCPCHCQTELTSQGPWPVKGPWDFPSHAGEMGSLLSLCLSEGAMEIRTFAPQMLAPDFSLSMGKLCPHIFQSELR